MQLLFQGKCEVLEESQKFVRTVTINIRLPSVMRLLRFIPLMRKKNVVRFSRENIFLRDQFTCQYCGRKRTKGELTLDHVVPSVQGGKKTWENIVSACMQCNQEKGGRTPKQAGMRLISIPTKPDYQPADPVKYKLHSVPETWKVYLSWHFSKTTVKISKPPSA